MNESKFFRRDKGHNRFGNDASGSDPWAYVSHEVSIDPIDDSGINVSNLEQRRNLWVPGTAIHPDHFSHPPVASIGMGLTPQKATESREKAGGAWRP